MASRREVLIPIGKRSYPMQTELDEEVFNRVVGILNEVSGSIVGNRDQDSLVILTCLQLAYNLEKISGLLETFDRKLSELRL